MTHAALTNHRTPRPDQGANAVSDKSPRQTASKKSAKSIKEKRAIKKSRKAADNGDATRTNKS